MTCPKCAHTDPKRFGTYGPLKIQRYRCRDCGATFSPPQPKPLGEHTTPIEDGAMINVYFAFYNFCRVHQTLRVTPAMQAGLTDHVWSIPELLLAS